MAAMNRTEEELKERGINCYGLRVIRQSARYCLDGDTRAHGGEERRERERDEN